MARKTALSAAMIRRSGVRVHGGSWTVFAARAPESTGRLIVALGRKAGGAVVRSRIRRVARDVYGKICKDLSGANILLSARGEVGYQSRRPIRGTLESLLRRGYEALARHRTV